MPCAGTPHTTSRGRRRCTRTRCMPCPACPRTGTCKLSTAHTNSRPAPAPACARTALAACSGASTRPRGPPPCAPAPLLGALGRGVGIVVGGGVRCAPASPSSLCSSRRRPNLHCRPRRCRTTTNLIRLGQAIRIRGQHRHRGTIHLFVIRTLVVEPEHRVRVERQRLVSHVRRHAFCYQHMF